MELWNNTDVFQKMIKMFIDLEYIKTYIDELLIITNKLQVNYNSTKYGLISIDKTLKEFRNILLGY